MRSISLLAMPIRVARSRDVATVTLTESRMDCASCFVSLKNRATDSASPKFSELSSCSSMARERPAGSGEGLRS